MADSIAVFLKALYLWEGNDILDDSSACGAGESVKPGVERSEIPGNVDSLESRARQAGDRPCACEAPFRLLSPAPRAARIGHI
jgi:hypothetical protein